MNDVSLQHDTASMPVPLRLCGLCLRQRAHGVCCWHLAALSLDWPRAQERLSAATAVGAPDIWCTCREWDKAAAGSVMVCSRGMT
jgi:hypothetical protein